LQTIYNSLTDFAKNFVPFAVKSFYREER